MDEAAVRAALKVPSAVAEGSFAILSALASLSNRLETQTLGRELIIRALAVRDSFRTEHQHILDSLIRGVGLFPYASESYTEDLYDALLWEAHRADGVGEGIRFHTLQLQVVKLLMAGRNVVLSATTSVGKSLVIDAIVAAERFSKIAIIVPTIALIDETRRRLAAKFGSRYQIITHPTQEHEPGQGAVYVLTQERAVNRSDLGDVDFFVVDEFYKLDLRQGDTDRAVDLNICFHMLASTGAQFYLIGPNIDSVHGLAATYDHVFIPSQFATVAVDVANYGLPMRGPERAFKLVELCAEITSPTLIYCQSPAKAAEAAEALLGSARFADETAGTRDAVDWLEREYPQEWVVTRSLRHGIGIHHGNVPRALQQYMVRAFEEGAIQFLVCTSTIIEGVNTVAENVILFDRRVNTSTVDNFTFKNISGRAGRMGRYFIGRVFVLEEAPPTEDFSVEVVGGSQEEHVPISLLLGLRKEEWTDATADRIKAHIESSTISYDTLVANRHLGLDAQRQVADAIRRDPTSYEDSLGWRGMPAPYQLQAACRLIHENFATRSLAGYRIFDGPGLAASLSRLANTKRFRTFIDEWVVYRNEQEESISEAVERALRFMRKYVSYDFPRQLKAIEAIFHDVMTQLGRSSRANYDFFAARSENLFIDAGLFALDEYGVPPETARRVGSRRGEFHTLQSAAGLLEQIDLSGLELHPFEKGLVEDLLRSGSLSSIRRTKFSDA